MSLQASSSAFPTPGCRLSANSKIESCSWSRGRQYPSRKHRSAQTFLIHDVNRAPMSVFFVGIKGKWTDSTHALLWPLVMGRRMFIRLTCLATTVRKSHNCCSCGQVMWLGIYFAGILFVGISQDATFGIFATVVKGYSLCWHITGCNVGSLAVIFTGNLEISEVNIFSTPKDAIFMCH